MKIKKSALVFIILFFVVIIAIYFIFHNNMSKKIKIGNNSTSQEIVDYILNISSYEVTAEVEVKSNKNENKYKIKQTYRNPDFNMQEVLEPQNIAGVKIIKDGQNLKIENSQLNLNRIFEKYEFISENALDLCAFIKDYQENEKSEWKEEQNNQIKMTTFDRANKNEPKSLYINKENGNPSKMEILDNNKNITVYILYNEVNVNGLK